LAIRSRGPVCERWLEGGKSYRNTEGNNQSGKSKSRAHYAVLRAGRMYASVTNAGLMRRFCVSGRPAKQSNRLAANRDKPTPKPSEPRQGQQFGLDHYEQPVDQQQARRIGGHNHDCAGDPMTIARNGNCNQL
jgi:hypothetical protein